MNGIFGVGLAEIVLVLIVLFVVGGPEHTARWAREVGRWIGKVRRAWDELVAEIESDLDDDGKDLLDAARELNRGVHEVRTMSPTRQLVATTLREVEGVGAEAPSRNGKGHIS
jgi:sec-independent protein translocase protein TatB